ncbi:uncharacterized protein LOC143114909 [Alosa pseudoharengus]|uniref:uncharacterized protein LOC143100943 n=1 Tax=Alosa pseudoharengus TaxID=34774 RepID=UPI003F8A20EC
MLNIQKHFKINSNQMIDGLHTHEQATQYEKKYINTNCATSELESEEEAAERSMRPIRQRRPKLYEEQGLPEKKRFAGAPDVGSPGTLEGSSRGQFQLLRSPERRGIPGDSTSPHVQHGQQVCNDSAPEKGEESRQLLQNIAVNKMTTMLGQLLIEVKEVGRDIQFLKAEMTDIKAKGVLRENSEVADLPIIQLPLGNEEDFDKAESSLEDEHARRYLVSRLALVGGGSSSEMIRRMLSAALTNNLACMFNWMGKRAKRAFKDTKMCECMMMAARRYDKRITEYSFGDGTKKWLRYAHERQGGVKRGAEN